MAVHITKYCEILASMESSTSSVTQHYGGAKYCSLFGWN